MSFIVVYGVSFFVVKCDEEKRTKKLIDILLKGNCCDSKKARLVVVVNQGNNTFLPLILMMFFFNYINSPASPLHLHSTLIGISAGAYLEWILKLLHLLLLAPVAATLQNLHFLHDAGCLADEGEEAEVKYKKGGKHEGNNHSREMERRKWRRNSIFHVSWHKVIES